MYDNRPPTEAHEIYSVVGGTGEGYLIELSIQSDAQQDTTKYIAVISTR